MKVWAEVQVSWEELIERAMRLEGWERRSQYVREIIRGGLKWRGLLDVQNGREKKEAVMVEG